MSEMATTHETEGTSLGVDNRKLAIWTFLGSEVMFFGGMIVMYVINRGHSVSGPLPANVLDVPLTAVNTFVLICSSMTMVTALNSIQNGDPRAMRRWLIATALLGLIFLSGQAYEFNKFFGEGLTLSTNLFGATFFTLTGFHGMHVFVGVIWITFVVARAFAGHITPQNHLAVELVGLYWHFVDLVWIIIFTLVYLI
ncbi:MAG: heme-copper oxidase subunit III [Chloroflexota bacterium]|nr:heme-copper oxidase subunit III [Chloroflexota bacterium]